MTSVMRVIQMLVLAAVAVAALVLTVGIMARFSDGPIGPFPGGKLSGIPVAEVVTDWGPIVAGVAHIELEVNSAAPRSVTTSYLVRDGALYVPSMLAARKRWPKEALADDRVVLRINGKLYPRRAVRITDSGELRALARSFDGSTHDDASDLSTWYFRMDAPRP